MADLITQTWLTSCLAGLNLPSSTTALYPQLTQAASRAIRKYCNRDFTRTIYDELYTPEPWKPIVLKQFPVNSVLRYSTRPTTVLTVTNTSASVQRATVQLATSGNFDTGQTVTGVTLYSESFGLTSTQTVLITANQTVQALATAITAAGGGWLGTPDSQFLYRRAADLRQLQGVSPATQNQQALLKIHVQDLAPVVDQATGTVWQDTDSDEDPFQSMRFGPYLETEFGDQELSGSVNGVRIVYDAGWDVIPEEVQQACVEVVKATIERLTTDTTVNTESVGERVLTSWATSAMEEIPTPALRALARYRNHRA